MSESTGKRKVFTAAAVRWLESQLEIARKNGDEMTTIKISQTGRLMAEDVAEYFRRNKFEANINKDSDVVYVVRRSAAPPRQT
jgi:hypothetical protein